MRILTTDLLLWVIPNLVLLAMLMRASEYGSPLDRPERRLPMCSRTTGLI